jgi:hypothetical protein
MIQPEDLEDTSRSTSLVLMLHDAQLTRGSGALSLAVQPVSNGLLHL